MGPAFAFVLLTVAGYVNRRQQEVVDYLKTENDVLRSRLGARRLRFTDDERARLALKGQLLGRALLRAVSQLLTPETILRWYRRLVALKYDGSKKRSTSGTNADKDTTTEAVGEPHAPAKSSWSSFLKDHEDVLVAADFFSVEVLTWHGLIRYFVFFIIEIKTRKVHIAGITAEPNGEWMLQLGRNLTDAIDGFLLGKRYIILDRDPLYTPAFRGLLQNSGIKVVRLPPKSPNLNAYAERFVLSVKSECLSCMSPFGEASFRNIVEQYVKHYHGERPHQGLEHRIIAPDETALRAEGHIRCRDRLGGLLKYYYR